MKAGAQMDGNDDEKLERQLDALFAAYREACPAPEPGPDFMPGLWRQLEARRSVSYSIGGLTRAFVTAAAAICLVLALLQAPRTPRYSFAAHSYVEALQEHSSQSEVDAELALLEGGGDWR